MDKKQAELDKTQDKYEAMLEELMPDEEFGYRMALLWNCSSFPMEGKSDKAIETYREQIKACLEARPDDPMGYAQEEMEKQSAEFNENKVQEEQETQDDSN